MSENFLGNFALLIKSTSFELSLKVLVFLLFSLHLAVATWVARDSAARSKNPFFQILAVAMAVFLPIFGLVFYLILRPSQLIAEKIIENFESYIAEKSCPLCGGFIKEDFSYCPHCSAELYKKCPNDKCGKKILVTFKTCPYCGKESSVKK